MLPRTWARPSEPETARGLTLVDILIALAITAVLVSLAVPSYQGYAERSRRAQAIRMLMEAAACQERLRAGRQYYDTTRCLDSHTADRYRFEIHPRDAKEALEYQILAIPTHPSGNACGTLSLDHLGTRGASDPLKVNDCWDGRKVAE